MPSDPQPPSQGEPGRALDQVMESLGKRLDPDVRAAAKEHLDTSEYRESLELIVDSLCCDDIEISMDEKAQLLRLAADLDSGDATADLKAYGAKPSGLLDRLGAFISLCVRWGYGFFFVLMAATCLGSVVLAVGAVADAATNQPVYWGTFVQEDCLPAYRECRSIGRWASDDGSLAKEHIYLDGHPGSDGRARASFQPEGFTNDTNNNIVHVESSTGVKLWPPFALIAMTGGMAFYSLLGWRRWRVRRGRFSARAPRRRT